MYGYTVVEQGLIAGLVIAWLVIIVAIVLASIAYTRRYSFENQQTAFLTASDSIVPQSLGNATGSPEFPNSSEHVVTFDTVVGQKDITLTGGVLTVAHSGRYVVTFDTVVNQSAGTSGTVLGWIRVNGVNSPFYGLNGAPISPDTHYYLAVNTAVTLLAGDTVEVIVAHSANTGGVSSFISSVAPTNLAIYQVFSDCV